MTAIIRVKRHRGDDPVEALILSCKRKKTEDSLEADDSFKKILNFSGTVEEKDDEIATNTVKSFNKGLKHSFNKTHVPEIKSKQRKEFKDRIDDDRFKLLSCLRSNNGFENAQNDLEDEEKSVTIVDVSKDVDEKSLENFSSDNSYVYDLYTTHFESDSDFNDIYMENLLSVQPLDYDLEYKNGEDCYEEVDPDEEDSNDENNWRNDYPDTDSEMEADEEDDILAKQMKGFHLDNDYELSGDSGEEEYLHYNDEDEGTYHYYAAEDLGGKSYARYKANAMKYLVDEEDGDKEKPEDEEYDSNGEYQDCNDSE